MFTLVFLIIRYKHSREFTQVYKVYTCCNKITIVAKHIQGLHMLQTFEKLQKKITFCQIINFAKGLHNMHTFTFLGQEMFYKIWKRVHVCFAKR